MCGKLLCWLSFHRWVLKWAMTPTWRGRREWGPDWRCKRCLRCGKERHVPPSSGKTLRKFADWG